MRNLHPNKDLFIIKLNIINLLGENILTLYEGYRSAGNYEEVFDTSKLNWINFSNGVYFYQLSVNGTTKTKK